MATATTVTNENAHVGMHHIISTVDTRWRIVTAVVVVTTTTVIALRWSSSQPQYLALAIGLGFAMALFGCIDAKTKRYPIPFIGVHVGVAGAIYASNAFATGEWEPVMTIFIIAAVAYVLLAIVFDIAGAGGSDSKMAAVIVLYGVPFGLEFMVGIVFWFVVAATAIAMYYRLAHGTRTRELVAPVGPAIAVATIGMLLIVPIG